MDDLAQAVAFLEPLSLAHGDLRPENVLLDRNRLKLSDFDCTAGIGSKYEACMAPYGRILNHEESDQGECGTFGLLGPRTEQFALGSLYYFINYGFEVYSDRCPTDDPYDHGPKVVELLQNMEFPKLDSSVIDNIIAKCWHNKYVKVAELATDTKALLSETTDAIERREVANEPKRAIGDDCDVMDQICLEEDFLSKKEFCQDLEKRGLLDALSSGEPREIGFTFEWYTVSKVECNDHVSLPCCWNGTLFFRPRSVARQSLPFLRCWCSRPFSVMTS